MKLKSDELKKRDQALAAFTKGFKDQLDEVKQDIKLGEERMAVIMKAYKDFMSQAIGQFDKSVDVVV